MRPVRVNVTGPLYSQMHDEFNMLFIDEKVSFCRLTPETLIAIVMT